MVASRDRGPARFKLTHYPLLWQEPISWAIAKTRQSDLERELAGIAGDGGGGDLAAAAARLADRAERGRALGRISMPTLRRSFIMVQGVGTSALTFAPTGRRWRRSRIAAPS